MPSRKRKRTYSSQDLFEPEQNVNEDLPVLSRDLKNDIVPPARSIVSPAKKRKKSHIMPVVCLQKLEVEKDAYVLLQPYKHSIESVVDVNQTSQIFEKLDFKNAPIDFRLVEQSISSPVEDHKSPRPYSYITSENCISSLNKRYEEIQEEDVNEVMKKETHLDGAPAYCGLDENLHRQISGQRAFYLGMSNTVPDTQDSCTETHERKHKKHRKKHTCTENTFNNENKIVLKNDYDMADMSSHHLDNKILSTEKSNLPTDWRFEPDCENTIIGSQRSQSRKKHKKKKNRERTKLLGNSDSELDIAQDTKESSKENFLSNSERKHKKKRKHKEVLESLYEKRSDQAAASPFEPDGESISMSNQLPQSRKKHKKKKKHERAKLLGNSDSELDIAQDTKESSKENCLSKSKRKHKKKRKHKDVLESLYEEKSDQATASPFEHDDENTSISDQLLESRKKHKKKKKHKQTHFFGSSDCEVDIAQDTKESNKEVCFSRSKVKHKKKRKHKDRLEPLDEKKSDLAIANPFEPNEENTCISDQLSQSRKNHKENKHERRKIHESSDCEVDITQDTTESSKENCPSKSKQYHKIKRKYKVMLEPLVEEIYNLCRTGGITNDEVPKKKHKKSKHNTRHVKSKDEETQNHISNAEDTPFMERSAKLMKADLGDAESGISSQARCNGNFVEEMSSPMLHGHSVTDTVSNNENICTENQLSSSGRTYKRKKDRRALKLKSPGGEKHTLQFTKDAINAGTITELSVRKHENGKVHPKQLQLTSEENRNACINVSSSRNGTELMNVISEGQLNHVGENNDLSARGQKNEKKKKRNEPTVNIKMGQNMQPPHEGDKSVQTYRKEGAPKLKLIDLAPRRLKKSTLMKYLRRNGVKCKYCDYISESVLELAEHITGHAFQCVDCSFSAKSASELKKHELSHRRKKTYACETCEYSTDRAYDLKRHKLVHSQEKPLKCKLCDFAAIWSSDLKEHMATHSNSKTFLCSECSFLCKYKGGLRKHQLRHATERKYYCTACPAAFKRPICLTRHLGTHMRVKPFSCPKCKYTSATKCNLKTHRTSKSH